MDGPRPERACCCDPWFRYCNKTRFPVTTENCSCRLHSHTFSHFIPLYPWESADAIKAWFHRLEEASAGESPQSPTDPETSAFLSSISAQVDALPSIACKSRNDLFADSLWCHRQFRPFQNYVRSHTPFFLFSNVCSMNPVLKS